jgi:hypothetical protein
MQRGRPLEAEGAARRVLEITPIYASAHGSLATILLFEGNPEAALV